MIAINKHIFTVIIFFFSLIIHSQVNNSVLANGNWFKFSVDTTGVFKIDKTLLQQIGISTNNLNPKKIHIYGNGGNLLPEFNGDIRYDDLQENAIYIEGEDDNSFDANDFILFYAKGPHSWKVDINTNNVSHKQNVYSDKAYYFITVNDNNGKRIQNAPSVTGSPVTQLTSFNDYIFYEKETTNLFAAGRRWLGEEFSVENQQTFQIPFPNAILNEPLEIKVRAVAVSGLTSSMQVNVNSQELFNLNFGAISSGLTLASDRTNSKSITNSSTLIDISLNYNNGGNPSARAYLDFIEVSGKKQLIAGDFQFSFRSFEAAITSGIVEYQIQNSQNIFQIWEVSDPTNVSNIVNESSATIFSFRANGGDLKEYIIVHQNDFYIPEAVSNARVENQNLHALKDINYLLITSNEFAEQAQRIANYHTENSGLTAKVVILDEIYNEFSSGSKDITGIRDFIKYVYEINSTDDKKLKYVCFFGDASYDYKDRIPANNNIVPVYLSDESYNLAESYVTDDFYAMLEDFEGSMSSSHSLDVVTGRIPVSNQQQATDVVDKILRDYNVDSFGDWRNTVTLLADDIDDFLDDSPIQPGVEIIADDIKENKPVFNINKIYADAYVQQNSSGGERYPTVKAAITTAIETGTLVFDYFGHGGEDGFAAERFLDIPQIKGFKNENTLPLFITITCEFSRFDNPTRISAGEFVFWNTTGGAASMITTTRDVYISVGQSFNKRLMATLLEFNNEDLTIAESLVKTKNNYSETQKFFIYYFGDPVKKLAIPKPNIRITKMNGVDITQSLDTLKALSKVSFEGVVTDNLNNILTDFNGNLSTTVYDKPIDKSTLDNDNFGTVKVFDSQESKLFRGLASVENGNFSFEFIVPRDVKIAYGKGKLSFYATDATFDKSGFNSDVIVGGINENAPEDTIGPEIQLFMNDESFLDGANTNASPNLIAKLADLSGINTSVTAVDHDIVGILDGDESNPIILNDFYQTELDDFTRGKVVFRLRDLSVGPHTLKLKAWDTYNNSSETNLNFVVVSDTNISLDNVLNYPNPFVNYTEFWFNHNKPNESLQVQVQIFTISGKLIKTINQQVQTTGNLSRNISWNGLDDFGNRIGKGVYVYKLKVTSTVSNISSEKYEKLVIL
ncbi:MAG: type IX secretion system sortase PorU [Flavobacteriaceae bacterium]|nr:type IX secretion system sortase PorU [Flavobacteriaceae bacterium]